MYSMSAINWHFWLATIGIVLYAASMWVTGIMEGLMWREVDAKGFLVNSFADTVAPSSRCMWCAAWRGAVPRRRADHVLEHVDDDPGRRKARPVPDAVPAE